MTPAPATGEPAESRLRAAGRAAGQRAVAAAYVGAWRGVGRLSEDRAQRVFRRIADRLHRRDGRGVQTLRDNLAVVRPDLDAAALEGLTREAVRSYLRYWCEAFRLPGWDLDDLVGRTRTVHEERLRTPYAEGRGVVSALPHQANWDWAGAWACATGMPVLTVAERLRPERVYEEFVAYREALGMRILPLTGGEPPLPALVAHLREGGYVCLLADRDLSGTAVEVELCGRPALLPAGPAMLARVTGAALVPTTLAYRGPDLEITFHPEVVVGPGRAGLVAAMQEVADAFTTALRADAVDWHMMQPVFSPGAGG